MLKSVFSIFFAALLFLLPSPEARAAASAWVGDNEAQVRLLSAVEAVGDGESIQLGVEIRMNRGWHTYWRSPGQAGLPPSFDWSRSETDTANFASAELLYPAPARHSAYNIETIGYSDDVLFPLRIKLRHPGQALALESGFDFLLCNTLCVPKHVELSLSLPAGAATASPEATSIDAALEKIPSADAEKSGFLLRSISSDGQNLIVAFSSRLPMSQPDIFVEDDKNIEFAAPVVTLEPGALNATATLHTVDTLPTPDALAGMKTVLTIVDGNAAAEIATQTPLTLSAARTTANPQNLPFDVALLLALIGGLILNLMPCVLPVLSLKVLSVIGHGGAKTRIVRRSFLTTAAGILFSFLLLALLMIGLKKFGLALGWGVQFQQPVFLMLLVLLLTFFAANLWGVFEVALPRFLADRLDAHYHPKLAGDFATGAFATLLATPCSAPFLGTAIGFALAAGAKEILATFLALGLGMAAPYIAVALVPQIATALPKPGAWMLRLRQLLGGALALTAVWLIWVLAAQITTIYAVGFGLLMLGIMAMLSLRKRGVKRGLILFGIAEFCLVGLLFVVDGMTEAKPMAEVDRKWISYNQATLNAEIAEGKTVFLDVTADWCLTCKANMKFTLSRDEVRHRLFKTDIIAMQANWTNPDPAIIELLHKYGRYGIPFNIVYGPKAPEGILLPELLSPRLVLDALDKASGVAP